MLFFVECQQSRSTLSDYTEPYYAPRYASGFTIHGNPTSHSSLITVHNPWYGEDVTDQQLFILRNGESVPRDYSGQVLHGEARRIICMSSSYIAMLDALGEVERVVGVSGANYILNDTVRKRIDEGKVYDIGFDANIDYERVVALHPDLVLLFGVGGANTSLTGKLQELSIPYLYMGEHCEESPLGKSEWLVVMAELIGQREQGVALFDAIPERYEQLASLVQNTSQRPNVMLNTPYRDNWFMPATNSYMVRLIRDAGARYVYDDNVATQTTPVDFERAYYLAQQADFWINVSGCNTLRELKQQQPRLANTPSVINHRVYDTNRRTNAYGGSDFWESGILRPDRVLLDLICIFHPEVAPQAELYYYRQLE